MPDTEPTPRSPLLGDWQDTSTPSYTFRVTPTETFFIISGKTSAVDGLTATYTIDWTTNPASIMFMPKQRGGKMPGLVKLEGDRMTLGLRTGGGELPRDFKACDLVLHYNRVKR
jgi:uncharacterized protein (TIGR03067 family)